MTICFTGHRPKDLGGYDEDHPMNRWVRDELARIVAAHPGSRFISGMALGADTWAAQSVVQAGQMLVAAVPCDGQASQWPPASQAVHASLLRAAAEVTNVCPGPYAAWKMQRRNEWMVDRADLVVAVWTGKTTGGTWNCIQYARRQGKRILHLDPVRRTTAYLP